MSFDQDTSLLRPDDLDVGDNFGWSISISGTPGNAVAIVGAPGDGGLNNGKEDAGAAYTYRDTGAGWVQDPVILRPNDLGEEDFFGASVSISGTPGNAVAIVGAYADDGVVNGKTNAGAAYTYRDAGNGWVQDPVILRPNDLDVKDYFGYGVSISGTPGYAVAIVGAYADDGVDNGKEDAGAAYTYRDTGTGWVQDSVILRPLELDADDYFGATVSISGTPGNAVAIVGAYGSDGVGNVAYIYRDTGDGWVQDPVILRPDDPDANNYFAASVSISGTPGNAVAIVGAFGDDGLNNGKEDAGAAYTYRDTGTGWVQDPVILRPNDLETNYYFGWSVSISGTPGAAVAIVGIFDNINDAAYTYRDHVIPDHVIPDHVIPCFHGSVLVETRRGLLKIKRIKLGDRVKCEDGSYQRVTHVTKSSNAVCVHFSPSCFGLNQPSHATIVTPNHLMKLPDGKTMRAGEAMRFARINGARMTKPVTVYHIGFDDWTFLYANNMRMESLAWLDHHHAARPYM